jgi:hypothetical protein
VFELELFPGGSDISKRLRTAICLGVFPSQLPVAFAPLNFYQPTQNESVNDSSLAGQKMLVGRMNDWLLAMYFTGTWDTLHSQSAGIPQSCKRRRTSSESLNHSIPFSVRLWKQFWEEISSIFARQCLVAAGMKIGRQMEQDLKDCGYDLVLYEELQRRKENDYLEAELAERDRWKVEEMKYLTRNEPEPEPQTQPQPDVPVAETSEMEIELVSAEPRA